MESPRVVKDLKSAVLQKIKEKKDTLYGQFSDTLTKKDKSDAWKQIFDFAVSIGAVKKEKGWEYLRDTFWPNLRRATMNKVDNAKQTGAAGGTHAKYNDTDNIVLDIIGKDSPTITSLGVPETWSNASTNVSEEKHFTAQGNEQCDDDYHTSITQISKKRKKASLQPTTNMNKKYELQVQNMMLLNEKLKVETYKLRLETLKLEKELGIAPNYTLCEVQNETDEIDLFENAVIINGNTVVDENV